MDERDEFDEGARTSVSVPSAVRPTGRLGAFLRVAFPLVIAAYLWQAVAGTSGSDAVPSPQTTQVTTAGSSTTTPSPTTISTATPSGGCNQSAPAEADVFFMLEDFGVVQPSPLDMVSVTFDQGAAVAHTRDGVHAIFWREDFEVVWAQNGNALTWSPATRPPSQPSVDMLTLLDGCLDE